MPDIAEPTTLMGLAWIIVGALSGVVIYLYKRLEKLQDRYNEHLIKIITENVATDKEVAQALDLLFDEKIDRLVKGQ